MFERVLDGMAVENGVLKEAQMEEAVVLIKVWTRWLCVCMIRCGWNWEGLWWNERRHGIAEKLVSLCMLFCEKVEACVVCIGYGLMDWFGVEEGVKAEESVESGVVAGRFL